MRRNAEQQLVTRSRDSDPVRRSCTMMLHAMLYIIGWSNKHFNNLISEVTGNKQDNTCFEHARHLDVYFDLELLEHRLLK